MPVGGVQGEDRCQFGGQLAHPGRGSADQELFGDLVEGEELLLDCRPGPWRAAWLVRSARAVVLLDDAGFSRRDQLMVSDDLASERLQHLHPPLVHDEEHGGADEPVRHRVAGRAEPHARQSVDLAADRLRTDLAAQRRQHPQQLPLLLEPGGGHRADLRMGHRVHLLAPRGGRRVRRRQVSQTRLFGDHQVAFGVADQVLHDSLRLRVVAVAEVGPEPVMGREPHVVRGRDDDVSDDTGFQTAHPISQHRLGHSADRLEALGQQRQRRSGAFVVGEAHEPHP